MYGKKKGSIIKSVYICVFKVGFATVVQTHRLCKNASGLLMRYFSLCRNVAYCQKASGFE